KTGTLTMIQGWNTRTISFERGRISYVAAGGRLPNISDLLVRNGRVSRNTVDQRRRQMSDADLVRALQREGQINEQDLQQCQDQLLESSIYTLFLCRNCYFVFKAHELIKEGGVPVSVDATH